jgi:F0F1-type ATP synthase assembly protein I
LEKNEKTKLQKVVAGADGLSLGISIVVAILLGVGLGLWLKSIFDSPLLLWLGVVWGIGGAGVNIYRAYKREMIEFEEIAKDPKYRVRDND